MLSIGSLVLVVLTWPSFWGEVSSIFENASACSRNSAAASYARSLSQHRLEKLYRDMERYSYLADGPHRGYSNYTDWDDFPEEFQDIEAVFVRPKWGYIRVRGCLDARVDLVFEGIGSNSGVKYPVNRIVLTIGEVEFTHEELWRAPKQGPRQTGER